MPDSESFQGAQFRRFRLLHITLLLLLCLPSVPLLLNGDMVVLLHIFGALGLAYLRLLADAVEDQGWAQRFSVLLLAAFVSVASVSHMLDHAHPPSNFTHWLGWMTMDLMHPIVFGSFSLTVAMPPRLYALVLCLGVPVLVLDTQWAGSLACQAPPEEVARLPYIVPIILCFFYLFAALGYFALDRVLRSEFVKASRLEHIARAEERERYTASLSHDLGTPVAALQLGLRRMQAEQASAEDQAELLSSLHSTLELLNVIRCKALHYSKLQHNKPLLPQPELVELRALADGIRAVAQVMPKSSATQVYYFVDDRLPPLLWMDKGWVFMMVINLVSNAFRHTPSGSVTVAAERIDADAALVRFVVRDTGAGVAPSFVPRLFGSFCSDRAHGTGLGLYHVSQLALVMGGCAQYEPNAPTGSVFWFQFPFDDRKPVQGYKPPPRLPMVPAAPSSGLKALLQLGPTLLVDDSPLIQELTTLMLEEMGSSEVLVAENGQVALDMLIADENPLRPAWILMDMQMPQMDGIECTQRIRTWEKAIQKQAGKAMRIIGLSANGHDEDCRRRCLEAGMDRVLAKPLSEKLLLECLASFRGPAAFSVLGAVTSADRSADIAPPSACADQQLLALLRRTVDVADHHHGQTPRERCP